MRSDEQIAKENDESRATVQRYIRLTRLIPELLQLVDEGRIALGHGVEIAVFDKKIQKLLCLDSARYMISRLYTSEIVVAQVL